MTQGAESPAGRQNNYFMMCTTRICAGWTIYMESTTENIIGFDALYESMKKCRKGVMWKDSTASYCLNGIERTLNLSRQLRAGTYRARPTVKFTITSPKPREIASITLRDRVYQRRLNDNAVYPAMSRSFIYDNYACQKGKGTDAARNRLKEFLRRYYRKYGCEGYVAQFDIHGYYPNMDHEITEELFRKKLDPETFRMVQQILRNQYEGEKGYNPGSQLIQIAGISILDRLDHYIKEQLHAKLYIRYMDDFLVISRDAEYLQDCMRKIGEKLRSLRFEMNPKKTRIYPLRKGIMFLGFRFRLTDTGKVIMLIDPKNVKRERLKLRRLVKRSRKGLIPREKVNESYASWRAHAGKGNTHNMLIRIDEFYKSLWEEDDNGDSHQKGNNEPQRQSGPGKHGGESRTDAGAPGLQHHDGESRGSRGSRRGGRIMEHSAKFELVKNYYNDGLWKKKAVKNAVKREWITATEYEEITGEVYEG